MIGDRASDKDLAELLMKRGHTPERVAYVWIVRELRNEIARFKDMTNEPATKDLADIIRKDIELHFRIKLGIDRPHEDDH